MMKNKVKFVSVFLLLSMILSINPALAVELNGTSPQPINPLPIEFIKDNYEVYLSDPIPFSTESATEASTRGLFPGVGQFAIVRRFPDNTACELYFT